jgi:hypothetical protein
MLTVTDVEKLKKYVAEETHLTTGKVLISEGLTDPPSDHPEIVNTKVPVKSWC